MSRIPINRQGADWQTLKAANLAKIGAWRALLEDLSVDTDKAHQLRGMIFALREQIAEVEPTPRPEAKDPHYG